MRILVLTIWVMGMISAAGQARAQTYDPDFPVCLHVVTAGGGTYDDCSYVSLAQCAMAAAGRAAQCNINPYYAGATASPESSNRRHRRAY